jgi:hypothetical protein
MDGIVGKTPSRAGKHPAGEDTDEVSAALRELTGALRTIAFEAM